MEKKNKMNPDHFIVPGCMFIGMGTGFIFYALPAGLLIGLGTGLLLTGIYKMVHSKEKDHGTTI